MTFFRKQKAVVNKIVRVHMLFQFMLITSLSMLSAGIAQADPLVLDLTTAIKAAQQSDPWLVGNLHTQQSVESMSIAAGTLPDPKASINLLNIPTDSFDFNQEPMTQFKIGISQMFPRGDSLALKQKQLQLTGSQFPYQRKDRKAKIAVIVGQLWLDTYKARESIALIEKDRPLFEQLADVAEASYSSALGRTRQQDIVRAQLELTRLDDRLTILKQRQEGFAEKLSEWLNNFFLNKYKDTADSTLPPLASVYEIERELPNLKMLNAQLFTEKKEVSPQILYNYFSKHPAITALDQKIKARNAGVDLARQSYKPEWGINGAYSYRDDSSTGGDRADFVSMGLTFDLPLFTSNRQDRQVASALSLTAAVKAERWQLIRKMIANFENLRTNLIRLNEREKLYRDHLLPQLHEQAEASLTAYTNDDGDFAEVVRARIAELNGSIDALNIAVERQKAILQLNYFFTINP